MSIQNQSIVEVKGKVIEGTLYDLSGVFYVGEPENYNPRTFSGSIETPPPYLFVSKEENAEPESVRIKMGSKRVLDITAEKGGIYMICCAADGMIFDHPNGCAMYRLIPDEDTNGNKVFDFLALMKSMGYVCRLAKRYVLESRSWEDSIDKMNAIASDMGVLYYEYRWLDCSVYTCTMKLAKGALLFDGKFSISKICVRNVSSRLYNSRDAADTVKKLLAKPHSVSKDDIPNFFEKYGTEQDMEYMSFCLYELADRCN